MTKKQINLYLTKLDWLFGLQHHEKEIKFEKQDKEDFLAEISIRHDYQRFYIQIYPKFFKESEEIQRKVLLHELCHTITDQMSQQSMDLLGGSLITKKQITESEEEATSKIENIIWGFLNKKFDDFIKQINK